MFQARSHQPRLLLVLTWTLLLACHSTRVQGEDAQKVNAQYEELTKLTEEDIARLLDGSPKLKFAYEQLFLRDLAGEGPAWQVVVSKDLSRRGDAATPLLIRSFKEDADGAFRSALLNGIENFPTINLAPFVDAARQQWALDGATTKARTCYAYSWILSRHGSEADKKILQEMAASAPLVRRDLQKMEKRLAGTLEPAEWHDPFGRPPPGYNWPLKPGFPALPKSILPSPANKSSISVLPPSPSNDNTLVFLVAGSLLAIGGLLWLVAKRFVKAP